MLKLNCIYAGMPREGDATWSQLNFMTTNRPSLIPELVARGIRITSPRRALLDTLQEAEGHLDAATLLRLAKKRDASIDRATVYRTLGLLKRLRLIDELDLMHLSGEKHFYEAKAPGAHVHLACFRCGEIEEFTSQIFERLQGEITRRSGFEITVVRLEAGGLCKNCRSSKSKT